MNIYRSAEYVSELEGGGDVAGSGLLLDPSVAQDLRAFDKKQWKQQKSKSSDRRQKQKGKKSTAPAAGVVVVAEVEEVGVGVTATDRGVLRECVEPGDCGVQDERDDPIC